MPSWRSAPWGVRLPPWWYDALALAYPDRLEEIIAAVNSEPPPTLRTGTGKRLRKWKAQA